MTPTVWVRPRQGPNLADLISQPGTTRAFGDSDPIDVLGSAYAATDGDPRTAWTAPQRVVQYRTPPNLTLKLPAPTEVAALRLTPSSSTLPAHPRMVAIDLGDGPQVRPLAGDGGAQTRRPATPRDRHGQGLAFSTGTTSSTAPPWVSTSSSRPDWPRSRRSTGRVSRSPPPTPRVTASRAVTLPCGRGPIIAVAGQFVQTSIDTTVGALLDGDPIPARPCQAAPIALPAGQQELLISPGAAFVVDGVQLVGPLGRQLRGAATDPVQTETWSADHREVDVPASQAARILVVPESINPGWTARTGDGTQLTPVTVNGWQQGWVVPRAPRAPSRLYVRLQRRLSRRDRRRAGAAADSGAAGAGAARRRPPQADPRGHGSLVRWRRRSRCWRSAPSSRVSQASWSSAGRWASRYLLRNRPGCCDAITVGTSAGGLILAGAVLSQNPWRSVDGYVGHSARSAAAGAWSRSAHWRLKLAA